MSQNVRAMVEGVEQAGRTTTQTRVSAEGLKQQADHLAALVGSYQLTG